MNPTFDFEIPFLQQGYTVIGVDEVGRGCFAGPVSVGAVAITPHIFKTHSDILSTSGIRDSKLLSQNKRESLAKTIHLYCPINSIAHISVDKINTKGIMYALRLGIQESVKKVIKILNTDKIIILIDGLPFSIDLFADYRCEYIVKGDAKSIVIASASIIAKVARDELMNKLHGHYPCYCWDKNKGYGTKDHQDALKDHGSTSEHRSQYIRKYV